MKEFCKCNDLNDLLSTLEFYNEKYGNIPIHIDLSMGKPEGVYSIDSVLFSTDENGNKFLIPTADFLRDLAKSYAEMGCPIENVTVSKSIWHVVNTKFNDYFFDVQAQVAKAIE